MIRSYWYEIKRNGNFVELHLTDGQGKTLAIGDFTIATWQQMERFLSPPTPPMSEAADHAVLTAGQW